MQRLAKVIVFVVTCAVTWAATTRLIARTPPNVPAAAITTTERLGHLADQAVSLKNAKGLRNVSAVMTMPTLEARLENGIAELSAVASIADKQSKEAFVWRVKALDSSYNMLDHHVYADQVFRMEPDGQMNPTFVDRIAVPLGTKYVSLSIYSFNDREDLSIFDSEDVAEKHILLRQIRRVAD